MDRFTISLDDHLADAFDTWVAQRGYTARSEAVRDLIRAALAKQDITGGDGDSPCVAALSYVYNHEERDLAERLTQLQHAHHDVATSTMHAHLDHAHCIEAVFLRGTLTEVRALADALCNQRGVYHGQLNLIPVQATHRHSHDGHDGHEAHVHLSPKT
ncbi:MAG: transcriptional regulator, CopG family [Pseudomonadota bacterium]|jgi:CopG family nickel-responsive transcriptional regulator